MPSSRTVVAVDVGGTDIKAALVEGDPAAPAVVDRLRRATPRGSTGTETADALVSLIAELVKSWSATAANPVEAVGVVVPGIVDADAGVGVFSANLGWRDYPFRAALSDRLGLPVVFDHDVRAGGLAESRLGAARGFTDAVVMPIGTGIAAALVLGGRLHSGGGYAGEVGHLSLGAGELCGCGQHGCLELRASSAAVARRYTERTGRPVHGAVDVANAVRAGDPAAAAVWAEAVEALAQAVILLTTLLGLQAVVLGGGLAMAGELLLAPLGDRLDELISFQRRPELRLAALGDEAGCLGAALLAMDLLEG
ncbi:ROK family protein [Crossiella sp. CA-258035]|uniref:ROK family protein n=1 Tax=Crossiella sp. CA-258035 TaxID=2981138 RepID=UPI0024BC556A|nr:ROK family protein [Crossiella sp. CA-258035]WHT19367.1 ROK family protein [Crossiella sp. CA-258035]